MIRKVIDYQLLTGKIDRMKKKLIFVLTLVCSLIGCASEPDVDLATPVNDNAQAQPYVNATQTAVVAGSAYTEVTIAPTEDSRPTPENWQDWPIIPDVTETAREIYRKGIAMGNDPKAFSKVGDCQNVKQSFLGFFDHPGKYEGLTGIDDLGDTIENFQGNFDRDGQSTQYGFNAAAVLSPLMADPDICLPDETPLECELRITRPTFVLISLEFWFTGRTPEVYERYMRKIIEYTMAQGAVPILATKADNIEKDNSLNLTTAQLAYEYDIPLWNWWAAAQPLGDHGIDAYRDGFHISVEAWNIRSKTFLQTLDHLWKCLRDIK